MPVGHEDDGNCFECDNWSFQRRAEAVCAEDPIGLISLAWSRMRARLARRHPEWRSLAIILVKSQRACRLSRSCPTGFD